MFTCKNISISRPWVGWNSVHPADDGSDRAHRLKRHAELRRNSTDGRIRPSVRGHDVRVHVKVVQLDAVDRAKHLAVQSLRHAWLQTLLAVTVEGRQALAAEARLVVDAFGVDVTQPGPFQAAGDGGFHLVHPDYCNTQCMWLRFK